MTLLRRQPPEGQGWTVETLRVHFDQRLDDMTRMLQERYEAQTKAMETHRHEAAAQMDAIAEKSYEAISQTGERLTAVEARMNTLTGALTGSTETRTNFRLDLGTLIGIIGTLIAMASLFVLAWLR